MPHARKYTIIFAVFYILAAWFPYDLEYPYTNGAVIDAHGVNFESPGLLLADARPIIKSVKKRADVNLRIELSFYPSSVDQHGPARILEIGQDHHSMNLMIGQSGDKIVARVRHAESDNAGLPPLISRAALVTGRFTNVALIISENIEFYVNADLAGMRNTAGVTNNWTEDAELAVGDSPVGDRAWLGFIKSGRIVLDGVEILDIVKSAQDMRPALILHIPERLRKVIDHYGFPPTNFLDILLNLFCFVPLGFLGARVSQVKHFHAALLLSLLTSMTMECGQIFFAERIPSLLDLLLNMSGGALGAAVFSRTRPIACA